MTMEKMSYTSLMPVEDGTCYPTHNEKYPTSWKQKTPILYILKSREPNQEPKTGKDPTHQEQKDKAARRGQRSREKERRNRTKGPKFWDAVWSIGEMSPTEEGDLQPKVEIGGNKSLFT